MLKDTKDVVLGFMLAAIIVYAGLGVLYVTHSKPLCLISMPLWGIALVVVTKGLRSPEDGSQAPWCDFCQGPCEGGREHEHNLDV